MSIKELVLDIDFYKNVYPDLRGLNETKLNEHWINLGYFENRCPSLEALTTALPNDFDPNVYLQLNNDLKQKYGNNILFASVHYYQYGSDEKRLYRSDVHKFTSNWDITTSLSHPSELKINKNGELIAVFFKV